MFAVTQIRANEQILEYKGKRVSWAQAQREYARSAAEDGHTFYFDLDDGRVIDGAQGGTSARWVNHSCAPNCEAVDERKRIYIEAIRDIVPGEELTYDYQYERDGTEDEKWEKIYVCKCGAPTCRGTILAPKKKRGKK